MFAFPALALAFAAAPQEEDTRTLAQALADGESVPVDRVLVILNDQVITQSQIQADAERLLRADPRLAPVEATSGALVQRLRFLIAREGFQRLSLDEALLEEETASRIQAMIEEAGSRARFEQRLNGDGYDLASFREALQQNLILSTWSSIVVGDQPSPLEGYRNQITITPEMIRQEFDRDPSRWNQDLALEWITLQFFDDVQGTGVARATETADRLRQGSLTIEEAAARANSAVRDTGDPARKNLREDLRTFLSDAQAGAVGPVDRLEGLGAQIVVMVGRRDAREISFEEAQPMIMERLRFQRRQELINQEMALLVSSSYLWYAEDLQGFMASVPGVEGRSGQETEL